MKNVFFIKNRKTLKVLTWNFASHPGKTRFWAHGAPHCFERDLNEKQIPKKMQKRGRLKNTRKYMLKWTWARRRFCPNRPNGIFWPPLRLPLAPDPSQDPPGSPKWPQNDSQMIKSDPKIMKTEPQMTSKMTLHTPNDPQMVQNDRQMKCSTCTAALALQHLHSSTCTAALAALIRFALTWLDFLHLLNASSHAWAYCTHSTYAHVLGLLARNRASRFLLFRFV